MKKLIIILLLFIPVISFAQNYQENKKEDVTITINVSKISKTLGSIVKFVKDETKQFKDEADANMSEEDKKQLAETKENVKYELKYIHDAIHVGWSQGWRGESYSPPYKHK